MYNSEQHLFDIFIWNYVQRMLTQIQTKISNLFQIFAIVFLIFMEFLYAQEVYQFETKSGKTNYEPHNTHTLFFRLKDTSQTRWFYVNKCQLSKGTYSILDTENILCSKYLS